MRELLRDRRSLIFAVIVAVGWAVFTLVYLSGSLTPRASVWFSNVGTLIPAWTVVLLSFLLWRSYDAREPARRIWSAMLIGFLLWGIGEALWAYFDIQPGTEVPTPSLADLAWSLGYPALWTALWLRYRSLEVAPGRRQWVALGAIVLAGLIVIPGVIWPILTTSEYDRYIERFVSVLYPVGDLILFCGAVLVASAVRGGRLSAPWQIIALGMACLGVADLAFTYADWNGLYLTEQTPNMLTAFSDVTYVGAYLAIAVGEYLQGRVEGTF